MVLNAAPLPLFPTLLLSLNNAIKAYGRASLSLSLSLSLKWALGIIPSPRPRPKTLPRQLQPQDQDQDQNLSVLFLSPLHIEAPHALWCECIYA